MFFVPRLLIRCKWGLKQIHGIEKKILLQFIPPLVNKLNILSGLLRLHRTIATLYPIRYNLYSIRL